MKTGGIFRVLSLLVVGALCLVACENDAIKAKNNHQPLPSVGPAPTLPSATVPPQVKSDALGQSVSFETATAPAEISAASNELAPTLSPPTKPPPTPLPADEAAPVPTIASVFQHTVQPGETLLGMAVDYGVSMASIQLANDMGDSIDLIAGQTLSIPGSSQWLGESYFWVVHVVQPGDTLVGLSSVYDLTVDEILRVNAVADPALIHVGQKLVMPLAQLVTLKAPQPTATVALIAAAPAAANAAAASTPSESDAAPPTDGPAPAETPPTVVPPPGPPSGPTDWPAYILGHINQVRVENGLNALNLAPELSSAAQAHAEDCARRGWGSHVGSDGAVLTTRLERAGYFGRNSSENWVQAPNAERAFEWWFGETPPNDPHRRNILSPHYTEIGVGIVDAGHGYIFVTDFGCR